MALSSVRPIGRASRSNLSVSTMTIYNNILTRGTGGRVAPVPSLSEVVPMSTYEELSLIVSVALLIVAILNYTHKK